MIITGVMPAATVAHGRFGLGARRVDQRHQADERQAALDRLGAGGQIRIGQLAPREGQHNAQALGGQALGLRRMVASWSSADASAPLQCVVQRGSSDSRAPLV